MAKWGEIKCPRCEELEAKLAQQDDLVQAAVAAALREAAADVSAVSMDGDYLAERILALIPDGGAALERVLAEAEARGMQDAADAKLLCPSNESVEYQRGWEHALLTMQKALTDEAAIRKGGGE